jgi:hypothetical protein
MIDHDTAVLATCCIATLAYAGAFMVGFDLLVRRIFGTSAQAPAASTQADATAQETPPSEATAPARERRILRGLAAEPSALPASVVRDDRRPSAPLHVDGIPDALLASLDAVPSAPRRLAA